MSIEGIYQSEDIILTKGFKLKVLIEAASYYYCEVLDVNDGYHDADRLRIELSNIDHPRVKLSYDTSEVPDEFVVVEKEHVPAIFGKVTPCSEDKLIDNHWDITRQMCN